MSYLKDLLNLPAKYNYEERPSSEFGGRVLQFSVLVNDKLMLEANNPKDVACFVAHNPTAEVVRNFKAEW